jgi:putative ABC transport system ATP-binding protein
LPIEWITSPTNFQEVNASDVAIARALVNKPSIIADEPTGNWTAKLQNHETFGDIHANGNTVILVTQEEIAAYAHRVIRLRDGLIEKHKIIFFQS